MTAYELSDECQKVSVNNRLTAPSDGAESAKYRGFWQGSEIFGRVFVKNEDTFDNFVLCASTR